MVEEATGGLLALPPLPAAVVAAAVAAAAAAAIPVALLPLPRLLPLPEERPAPAADMATWLEDDEALVVAAPDLRTLVLRKFPRLLKFRLT